MIGFDCSREVAENDVDGCESFGAAGSRLQRVHEVDSMQTSVT